MATPATELQLPPQPMNLQQVLRLAPSGPQLGLVVALAAALTLAVGVVMWAMRPSMVALGPQMRGEQMREVVDLLRQRRVAYEIKDDLVLVPSDRELELASDLDLRSILAEHADDGPLRAADADSMTQTERDKFRLAVAYKQRRLERTIAALRDVRSSRVTLAIPMRREYFRDRNRLPSAAVSLRLAPGRVLDAGQVHGISSLVAAAVEGLDEGRVKIIDGRGRQLNDIDEVTSQRHRDMAIEQAYEDKKRAKAERILDAIVGPGNYEVQVGVEMDFATVEKTTHTYSNERGATVSMNRTSQGSDADTVGLGVPGAETNQPPDGGTLTPPAGAGATGVPEGRFATTQVQNMQPGSTVEVETKPSWAVKRLNLAVVVGDKVSVDEAGETVRAPWEQGALDNLMQTLKAAVSIDEQRGDTLSLVNQAMMIPETIAEPPPPAMWEESWFEQIVKSALAGLALMLLVLMVIRPTARALLGRNEPAPALAGGGETHAEGEEGEGDTPLLESDRVSLSNDGDDLLPPPSRVHGDILNLAKEMAAQDPKRIATLLKKWMDADE